MAETQDPPTRREIVNRCNQNIVIYPNTKLLLLFFGERFSHFLFDESEKSLFLATKKKADFSSASDSFNCSDSLPTVVGSSNKCQAQT